jgi:exopolysaccharide biosynthesis polyprenyl glycosylphosphotransferase
MSINGKTPKHVPRFLVALGDVGLVLGALYLAFLLRFGGESPPVNFEAFLGLAPWVAGGAVAVFVGLGLYDRRLDGFSSTLRALLTGVVLVGLITAATSYWFRELAFPRSIILIGGAVQLVLLVGWRWLAWWMDGKLHGQRRLLVLGEAGEVTSFLGRLLGLPGDAFCVAEVVRPEETGGLVARLGAVDGLVIMPSVPPKARRAAVAASLEKGCEVYLVPDMYEVLLSNTRVSRIDDLPVLQLERFCFSWFQLVAKRAMDLVLASVGLVVSLPVLIGLLILIPATSKGSPFYVQERVGQNGRIFRLYKLRTMVANAEERTGPILAAVNDSRITRVGRLLRATRLDELPQLFNVLRGEMSIVGPRPERSELINEFKIKNLSYHYRHLVKPGLTGLAQVYGRYDTSAEDKLRFDLYYLCNYSLLLDLQILLRTIPVVFTPSAACGRSAGSDSGSVANLSGPQGPPGCGRGKTAAAEEEALGGRM